jgi:hypothetical protein
MCLGCRVPVVEPLPAPFFLDPLSHPSSVMAKLTQVEVEISLVVSNDISHVWTIVSSHVGSAGQDHRVCGFTARGAPLIEASLKINDHFK